MLRCAASRDALPASLTALRALGDTQFPFERVRYGTGVDIVLSPPLPQSTAHQTLRRLLGRNMARKGVLFFSCFLLLTTLLPAFAQEALWKDLDAKAFTLYKQGRYAEAAKVAKEALKVAEANLALTIPMWP